MAKCSRVISLRLSGLLLVLSFTNFVAAQAGRPLTDYAGRYTDGRDIAVYFEVTKYGLTIRPMMWTATQLLRETSPDKLEVADRASRGARFFRDQAGNVVRVEIRGMEGEGVDLRRAAAPLLPAELLLEGNIATAVKGYRSRGMASIEPST